MIHLWTESVWFTVLSYFALSWAGGSIFKHLRTVTALDNYTYALLPAGLRTCSSVKQSSALLPFDDPSPLIGGTDCFQASNPRGRGAQVDQHIIARTCRQLYVLAEVHKYWSAFSKNDSACLLFSQKCIAAYTSFCLKSNLNMLIFAGL